MLRVAARFILKDLEKLFQYKVFKMLLSKVLYQSKDGKEEKTFDALEWLAAMCSHVPNKGEHMVRYYGYYSNVSRGKRRMLDQDALVPSILDPDELSKESGRNWARLIQKIYEVDPLTCPKCSGAMKVISVIEDRRLTNILSA